jgi:CheY-like chemotaxis protein
LGPAEAGKSQHSCDHEAWHAVRSVAARRIEQQRAGREADMQPAIEGADEDRDTLPPPACAGSVPAPRQLVRVLLVEPAPLIRTFITRALRVTGYEVHSIATFAELERALGLDPDLVLVELNLADGSGDAVCRRTRARFGAHVPLVLMSTGTPEELARRAAGCDADRCFSKLRGLDVLLPIVHELSADARLGA